MQPGASQFTLLMPPQQPQQVGAPPLGPMPGTREAPLPLPAMPATAAPAAVEGPRPAAQAGEGDVASVHRLPAAEGVGAAGAAAAQLTQDLLTRCISRQQHQQQWSLPRSHASPGWRLYLALPPHRRCPRHSLLKPGGTAPAVRVRETSKRRQWPLLASCCLQTKVLAARPSAHLPALPPLPPAMQLAAAAPCPPHPVDPAGVLYVAVPTARSRHSSPPTNRTGQPSRHQPPTRDRSTRPVGGTSAAVRLAPGGCAAGTTGYGEVTEWQLCLLSTQQQLFQCAAAGGGHPWRLCGAHHPRAVAGTLSPAQPPIAHTWGRLWQGLPPLVPAQPSSSAQPSSPTWLCSVAPSDAHTHVPLLMVWPMHCPCLSSGPCLCSTCCTARHTL